MKNEKIYKRAWKTFGKDKQLDMIIEECSELIKEVCMLKRERNVYFNKIVEEMADVEIMNEQFRCVYDLEGLYSYYKRKKLDRLERRLNEFDKN